LNPRRFVIIVIASGGFGLGCLFLFGGCGDDSKTTGTQVEISPAVKAELDDMKSAQQEVRAERKQQRASGRGKRN
jgi:hypothetical protein